MKKRVQNLMRSTKNKNEKGFLRATALMMAFMLLLGSVDVSAFAAQNETDEAQTVSVQPEETAADVETPKQDEDSVSVDESKEDSNKDSEKESEIKNNSEVSEEQSKIANNKETISQDDTENLEENSDVEIYINELQKKIDALPTVEVFMSMSSEEQNAIYETMQKLADEYESLSDEEQALLDISKLVDLFEYSNSQIATTAEYAYDSNKNYALYNANTGLTVTFTLTGQLQELLDWVIFLFDPDEFKNVGYDTSTHKLTNSGNMDLDSAKYAFTTGQGGTSYNQLNKVLAVTADTSAKDLKSSGKTLSQVWTEKNWVVVLGPHHKWNGTAYYNCDYYVGTQKSVQEVQLKDGYSFEPITINKDTLNGSTVWGIGDTQFTMDRDGGFFSSDKQKDGAFPDNGKIITSDNVPYQLQWTGSEKYSGNDSIRLAGKQSGNSLTSDEVTVNLLSYGAYDKIFVLGTAGGFSDNTKSLNFSVKLTYTDGTSSTTTYNLYDWYQNASVVIKYVDGYRIYKRLNANGSKIDEDYGVNGGPMVQSKAIECDESKLLKSISFQIANTDASVANANGIYSAIYAVTGAIQNSAPKAPQGLSANDITDKEFTAFWNNTDNASGYYIDVSEYENFYDASGNPSFVGKYNNLSITTNSCKIEGLKPGKQYYYRVRAFGNGAQSASSSVATVTTLYTAQIKKADGTTEYYDSLDDALAAAEEGDEIIVDGTADLTPAIKGNAVLKENVKLTIPSDKTITVESGAKFENNGLISGEGKIQNNGNVINKESGTFKIGITNENSSTFTNEANSSWKESGSDNTYYGPLDAALKETESKKTDITVSKDAVINGDVTLGNDSTLTVTGNSRLEVTKNGSLQNNGTLNINNGSEMTNAGAVTGSGNITNSGSIENKETGAILSGVKTTETGNVTNKNDSQWTIEGEDGKIYYGSLDNALDDTKDKNADITLDNDAKITGDKKLGENVSINVPSDKTLTVSDGGSLTIPKNGNLNVEGSVDVAENGKIENNGTVDVAEDGNMTNAGQVTGTGDVANKGNIINEETGTILSGVTSTDSGKVENRNESHWSETGDDDKIYYGSLDKALDETKDATEKTDITLDKNAQINGDKELGENVSINVPENKKLTVSDDSTLTIPEKGNLNVEGSVSVAEKGTITNNGNVSVDTNGTITNAGNIVGSDSGKIDNAGQIYNKNTGTIKSDIKTDTSKNPDADVTNFNEATWTVTDKETGEEKTYYGSLSDAAKDANAKAEETTEEGDKKYNSVIKVDNDAKLNEDITLKDGVDLVVPDGTTVTVPEDTKLTISEGASLKNNGTLDIKQTGSLEIEGKLDVGETGDVSNSGELSGTGDVENKGTIVNDKTGTVKADHLSNVDNGTFKNKNDVSLTDKDGNVYYYSSLDEALKDARERDDDVVINTGSRIDPTIKATGEDGIVEIPENVTIVIPENKQLTIANGAELEVRGKIENNGTILNCGALVLIPESNLSGSGTLNNVVEASWKDSETGMAYYGPLKDALEKAGQQGTTEGKTDIKIDLEKDTEINENTTIPGNVTVTIPEDKSLTVKAPAVLDVEGTLENEGDLNISEGAGLNVSGTFDNNGKLDLEGNADLTVSGTFNNNGTISAEAQWTDENDEKHYGTLKDALDSGAKDIELNKDTTLTEDTVIPEGTTVTVKNGATITVPADKSLEINGTLNGANENTVINQNEASWKNPATGNEYYGPLKDALDKASSEEGNVDVTLDQDAKIDGDTTIPGNITLVVPEDKNLDVSGKLDVDGKLENQGNVTIKDGVDLTVSGTLENTGDINLENGAKLDVPESGTLDNTGNINLKDGSGMDVSGTVENGGNVTTEGNATVKLPSGSEDSVNSNAEAQWKDSDGNTHFGTLNEALKSGADDIILNNNATLTEDTVIPEGTTVTVKNGATITVPDNSSLEINGNLEGANENTIINQNEASWKNPTTGNEYYGPLKDALDKASDEKENIDVTLDQDAALDGNTTSTIPENITVVVSKDKTLEVSGNLNVAGKLENQGNVTVKDGADLTVSGTLENTGDINLEKDAKLDVPESGTLDNTGNINLKDGSGMDVSGTVENGGNVTTEGNATVKLPLGSEDSVNSNAEAQWKDSDGNTHFGTLNEALKSGADDIILNNNATLTGDAEIPKDTTVTVKNGATITVSDNSSLEINGKLEGANENTVINQNEASWKNPTNGKEYYGPLKDALDKASDEEGNIDVTLDQDVALDGNTTPTIPGNIALVVPENKNLDVSGKLDVAGKLENQGNVTVKDGADLTVSGTLENTGDINLENGAKLDVPKDGKLDNIGNINLKDGSGMDVSGTVENGGNVTTEGNATVKLPSESADSVNSNAEAQWKDSDGNTHFGTLNDALKSGATDIILNNNATLTEDTVIPKDTTVTVKNGATITVPDNSSLTINGTLSGADENTIINQNEASWKNPETGKQFYGNLNDVLTKTEEPENTPSQITVKKNAELDVTKHPEIPAGVTVEVEEGANLTLTGNGKLDVKGDILNNGKLTIDQNTSLEVSGKLENKEGASVENKNEAHWVDPETGNAYYGTLDEVLEKANEKATSENPATVVVDHNATLKNDMNFDNIQLDVKEDAEISIENGVNLPKDVVEKIEKNNECTWKDSNGTHYGSLESALKNQTSGTIKVTKDAEIKSDVTVASGVTIEIPEDKTITIAKDKTMQVDGAIQNNGTIKSEGTVQIRGEMENTNTGLIRNEGIMQISGSMTNNGTIANLDTIKGDKGSFVTNANGALIKGSGSIENSGNLINKGSISVEGTVNGITNKGAGKVQSNLESTLTKEHEYGSWIIDEEATATKEGRQHRVCEDCGHTVYQTIPAKGSESDNAAGKSYKEVIKEQGAFDTNLNNEKKELFDSLLDAEEKEDVDTFGSSAYIWLEVAPSEKVTADDKQILEQTAKTLGDNAVVQYNDISLYKRVGFGDKEKITNTQNLQVSITIDIPVELTNYNKDTVVRKFYMLRAHEGEGTVIDNGIVSEDGTKFTFTTTLFSTYALAYVDSAKTSGGGDNPGGGSASGGNDNPGGGSTSNTPNGSNQSGTTVSPDGSNQSQSDGTQNDSGLTTGKNDSIGTNVVSGNNTGTSKHKKSSSAKNTGSKADGSKESSESTDQVASADNDSKKDNASTDSKNDKQGQEDANNADSGQTSVAETIEKPSKNVEKQLKDAFAQIKKLDSEIQSGPYVQIDASNIEFGKNNNDGKVKFTLNIPEDIVADGRTFYLVTVDSEGNIVVLQNESLEDGVFSATGDPDATYQIVYEDGESTLAELVSEDGSLMDTNGNVISVKTVNTCFWHWIIAVLALIGVVLTLLARKKKQAMIVAAIDTVLMLVCVILGSCRWDIVTMLIGVVLLAAGIFIRTRRTSREVR